MGRKRTSPSAPLCAVNVREFVALLRAQPPAEWRRGTDMAWNSWGVRFGWPIAHAIAREYFPDGEVYSIGLWTVEPGQVHPAHTDQQPEAFLTRVHVPLVTNERATITLGRGEPQHWEAGYAYKLDTREEHAIENLGDEPRVHFVFDIHRTRAGADNA